MNRASRTSRFVNSGTAAVAAGFIALAIGAGSTFAEGSFVRPVDDPTVRKECSACHMAYPAGLMPARSWQALMGNLSDHFGDNAELDPAVAAKITAWLVAHAGDAGGRGGRMMRITEMPRWTRKHERRNRVSAATLKRRGAAFKGDCKACHTGAEKGVFEDD